MKLNSHRQIRRELDKESIHALPFEYDPTSLKENEGYFYTRGMETKMTLNKLAEVVNLNARNKGFYNKIEEILALDLTENQREFIKHLWYSNRILLVISEMCEGFEGIRSNNFSSEPKSGGLAEELADAQIRIADFSKDLDIDLEKCVEEKMQFNSNRPHMHGGKLS